MDDTPRRRNLYVNNTKSARHLHLDERQFRFASNTFTAMTYQPNTGIRDIASQHTS